MREVFTRLSTTIVNMDKIRILVVEDDVDLRETLEEVLSDEGYEVTTAERGEDAVTLASQQVFDLVVTDIKMPGIDGLEALEQVKQRQPEVKSLVVTGYSSHQDAVRAVRLGVGEYLQKPFGLDSLLQRVAEMVEERQAEQAEKSREQEHWRATLGALKVAAHLLDPRLLEAARKAESLSTPSTSLQAQAATLALGCKRLAEEISQIDFGLHLDGFLRGAQEHWDGSGPEGKSRDEIPLESRIAALVLHTTLNPDAELPEGRFDPELAGRLSKPTRCAPTGAADQRSLLTLGQAFERGGDLENAYRAYEGVLDGGELNLTAFEAALGKARIERAIRGERLPRLLKSVRGMAKNLGDQVRARAVLEGGLLLLPDPEAKAYLLEAQQLYGEQGDELGLARAHLGLASLGEEAPFRAALEVLLQPEHIWELSDSSYWMLPWLLAKPDLVEPGVVVRVLGESARGLKACMEDDSLSIEARLHAVDALRKFEGDLPLAPVRVLMQDKTPQIQKALEALKVELKSAQGASLKLVSFGPFVVSRGDESIAETEWKHQKVKYLLAYLAKNWRTPVPDEQLMEEFWPGPADRAKRSLYQATYNLRRCLKDPDAPQLDYIRRERGCLSLNEDLPIWNDYKELEEALSGGCEPDNRAMLNRALRLYRGPYLERCYMDWAVSARGSLELKVMEALEWLTQDQLSQGNKEGALQHARQLFELDPLSNAAQLLTMKALVGLGQSKQALDHFKVCEDLLRQELNLEPTIEMLQLRQAAKLQDEPSGLIG